MLKKIKHANVIFITVTALLLTMTVGGLLVWLNGATNKADKISDSNVNSKLKDPLPLPKDVQAVDTTLKETNKSLSQDLDVSDLDQEIDTLL